MKTHNKIVDEYLKTKELRLRRHPIGFIEVKDKPSQEELQKYYADKYYQTNQGNYRDAYSSEELSFIRAKIEQRFEAVVALGGKTTGSFLDVGCGEGHTLAYFAINGWQVKGIDYSEEGLKKMNPTILSNVMIGDMMQLLADVIHKQDQFDVVWLNNVLEHVIEPVVLLQTLRKIVKPDGFLVVTVPNDFSELQMTLLNTDKIDRAFWVALPDHLAYFDYHSLRNIATETGWQCKRILADFPIDWYLLNDHSNYVQDRSVGPMAHASRIAFENLLHKQPVEKINLFYEVLASVGGGRDLTAFLQPI